MNLCSIVYNGAERFPNAPALLSDEGAWSYRALARHVAATARALATLGVSRGDRVALMARNGPHFTVAYFAILSLGAIVVPINVLLKPQEVAFFFKHADVRAVVFDQALAAVAASALAQCGLRAARFEISSDMTAAENGAEAPDREAKPCAPTMPDDTAVIFYTSGTTGQPKGAELTHFNLYANAQWVSERSLADGSGLLRPWGPGTVAMAVLPLSHSFGQTCMQNAPLMNGGAVTCCATFDAEALVAQLEKRRVTVMASVPRMVRELLRVEDVAERDLSAFKYCLVGGATIDLEQIVAFERRFGVEVLEGYGLSETSPVVAFRTPETPRRPGSVGRAISGVSMRVVDELGNPLPRGEKGELALKGHPVMKGYYRNAQATALAIRDGWFLTGDICVMDDLDLVYVVDRKKDVIIRNGFNVYPAEVEAVLLTHPRVRDAAVVGVPDAVCGEEVKAIVVGNAEHEELIAFCRARMAPFKYPRIIEFRESLPRGIKGQILRRALREDAQRMA